jgi:hypothetical protein
MRAPVRPTHPTTTFTSADAAAAIGSTSITSGHASHAVAGSPAPSSRRFAKLSVGLFAAALAALALTPTSAEAQFRQVVEFTCPLVSGQTVPPADPFPGALVAENGYVYYVTRAGDLRLVRLTPSLTPTCNWWDLDDLTVTTGGLRFKTYSNQAFIRGVPDLQRINTVTNVRTRWVDGLASVGDIALKSSSTTHVYTTGVPAGNCDDPTDPEALNNCDPTKSVVQRFSVGNGNTAGYLTQWKVGGGAGLVPYSGIDVNPCYPNLVYYSEPLGNNIGELNTTTNEVRRWNLTGIGVETPRQLDVDANGIVWVGTGTGLLVRLDPTKAANNVHVIQGPFSFLDAVVGIDADGLIGYTTFDQNKVGMFSPDLGAPVTVAPSLPVPVTPSPDNAYLAATSSAPTTQFTGLALRVPKTVDAVESDDLSLDGHLVEALMPTGMANNPLGDCVDPPSAEFPEDPCTSSFSPQGIATDPAKAGSYFAAIGGSVLRVAHVSLIECKEGGGAMTGSGKMALTDPITGLPAGTGYFTLWAVKNSQSQPAKGALTYTAPDGKVQSLQITGLTFSGNTATITGLCKTGSNCTTFQVKGTDGGWQSSQDIFKIIKDPILGAGLERGGNLASGGIRTYRWQ